MIDMIEKMKTERDHFRAMGKDQNYSKTERFYWLGLAEGLNQAINNFESVLVEEF